MALNRAGTTPLHATDYNAALASLDQRGINVRDYGARGDGITDDGAALLLARAAAVATGGALDFPPGIYGTTQIIPPANNLTLRGAGMGASIIRGLPGLSGGVVYDGGVYTDFQVRDLTFDANSQASVSAFQLYSGGHTRLRIERCRFIGSSGIWCLRIGNTGAASVNCALKDSVVGACASGSYEACLLLQWQDGKIGDNTFRDRTGTGGAALGIYAYHQGLVVSRNVFANNAVGDLYVQQSDNVVIEENIHSAAAGGTTAIQVINCADIQILGNEGRGNANTGAILIYDYSADPFDGSHASLHPDTTGVTLDANRFVGYYQGFQVPAFPTSTGHRRKQSNIHLRGNTFRTVAYAPVLLSCATAQQLSDIQIEGLTTDGGAYTTCGAVEVQGNPGFTGTTTTQIIAANAVAQAVTLAATPAGLVPGQYVSVDTAGNQETIQVVSVQGGTGITAIFTKAHASGVAVVIDPSVVSQGIANLTIADARVRPPSTGATASGVHVDVATDVRLLNNDLRGAGTSGRPNVYLTNGGALALARGNLGYNPVIAVTPPAFPATGVWVQNTTGVDVQALITGTGVTGTHIYVNTTNSTTGAYDVGTFPAVAAFAVTIPAGAYVSAVYSAGTPTWTWMGL